MKAMTGLPNVAHLAPFFITAIVLNYVETNGTAVARTERERARLPECGQNILSPSLASQAQIGLGGFKNDLHIPGITSANRE